MADSVREGAAKRKEKVAKIANDNEELQIGAGGGLSNKREEKTREKEKKRKGKMFNLTDLLSNDCDNITGKRDAGQKPKLIGEDGDKELEEFLKSMQANKKRFKAAHDGQLTKKSEKIDKAQLGKEKEVESPISKNTPKTLKSPKQKMS